MTHNKVESNFLEQFKNLIESSKQIYITSHLSPDDDAISSTLALYHVLISKYPKKQIKIILSGKKDDRYQNFQHYAAVEFATDISGLIQSNSLLIMLDGNQYQRFTNRQQDLVDKNLHTICIDHHQGQIDEFDLVLSDTSSSSTAELIYLINQEYQSNPDFAYLILLGILGDTGTFNYITSQQTRVFDIVKNIINTTGIDIQTYKSQYNNISRRVFKVLKQYIKNTRFHSVAAWPKFSTSYISHNYISRHHLSDSDVSEAGDIYTGQYLRVLKNYTWGFTVKAHSDNTCHISFRSLPGSTNVRELAVNMKIGGGHDRAAGGILNSTDPKKAIEEIKKFLRQHKPLVS